ncbi:vWA domain-containing protein [Actinophytocola sediminis]
MDSEVLPCYVVCDVSFSMTDHLAELNAGLREFRGAVHADPTIAARVRVCVVGFAETPAVLQPLRPAAELADLTEQEPSVGTNFGPAFAFLREAIDRDVRALKDHRLLVRRPLVFFTSDGQPTDPVTWPMAYAALTDPAWTTRPNVIAFGVGDADEHTLGRIGTCRMFLGRDGVRLGAALTVSVAIGPPRLDHV